MEAVRLKLAEFGMNVPNLNLITYVDACGVKGHRLGMVKELVK
ncbi:hypothetical protein NTGM5_440005 [Candidatus Nitrotoga sp. M5]|nr:hypothetical protein NTGM5_440005 [Candidatus Nitrotoga sp. M5]